MSAGAGATPGVARNPIAIDGTINQVGAIVAALGVVYVIEPLLSVMPGVNSAVQRFGLGGLTSGASGTTGFPSNTHILGQVPAGLVLGSYALAVVIVGAYFFRRRDLVA
jgi:hypothetical protein